MNKIICSFYVWYSSFYLVFIWVFIFIMGRIPRGECFWFSGLCFVLASAKCRAICRCGLRLSTYNCETMVLSQKRLRCPLMVDDEFLSKVEKVKYLRVVNKMPSQGLVEGEWNRRLTGGLLRCLQWYQLLTILLSQKEHWILRGRSASKSSALFMKISILWGVAGLSHFGVVSSPQN